MEKFGENTSSPLRPPAKAKKAFKLILPLYGSMKQNTYDLEGQPNHSHLTDQHDIENTGDAPISSGSFDQVYRTVGAALLAATFTIGGCRTAPTLVLYDSAGREMGRYPGAYITHTEGTETIEPFPGLRTMVRTGGLTITYRGQRIPVPENCYVETSGSQKKNK